MKDVCIYVHLCAHTCVTHAGYNMFDPVIHLQTHAPTPPTVGSTAEEVKGWWQAGHALMMYCLTLPLPLPPSTSTPPPLPHLFKAL